VGFAVMDESESAASDTISKERVEAMRRELSDLSQLNAAMFGQMFSDELAKRKFFAARYDKTDRIKDDCDVTRGWDLRIEGDFYLVKQIHNFIYIIVGDATGHHAYAGGLQVFVAAALQSIFDQFTERGRPPTSTKVLKELNRFFFRVGRAALIENKKPLEHGADAVVIRVETTRKTKGGWTKKTTYASAGLPVIALSSDGPVSYGCDFYDSKGIGFPTDLQATRQFEPETGSIDVQKTRFLAVVTDGFRGLGRKPRRTEGRPDEIDEIESFGDVRVRGALVRAAAGLEDQVARAPAATIASALVESARDFRRGHMIPETSDDDRLVVIVDLEAL
jgi:hypothetical protein